MAVSHLERCKGQVRSLAFPEVVEAAAQEQRQVAAVIEEDRGANNPVADMAALPVAQTHQTTLVDREEVAAVVTEEQIPEDHSVPVAVPVAAKVETGVRIPAHPVVDMAARIQALQAADMAGTAAGIQALQVTGARIPAHPVAELAAAARIPALLVADMAGTVV